MEKEIVWTSQAQNDFWEIVTYRKECWPQQVLDNFEQSLNRKSALLINIPTSDLRARNIPVYAEPF